MGKRENAAYQHFFPFPTFSKGFPGLLNLSQTINLDSSKLKEFADNNFKLDENGRKFPKRVQNTVGKGKIARYEQLLLFPHCFKKTCIIDM